MKRYIQSLTVTRPLGCRAVRHPSLIGGLGEAVGTTILRARLCPAFRQIALPDEVLEAGSLPVLHDRYSISVKSTIRQIKSWL